MSAIQLRIVAVVDVVAALAADALDGAVWLVDSNKTGGSTDQGTRQLKTAVRKGDQLIWTTMSLECEAFVAIDAIEIDQTYCEITHGFFAGTDIGYWLGSIRKDPGESEIPYNLVFKVGSRAGAMSLSGSNLPAITGGRTD